MVLDAQSLENLMSKKVLIISDDRAGHENQSIAFCNILKYKYDILHVRYENKFLKALSYFFDFLNIYTKSIFTCKEKIDDKCYEYIVTCGSATYYPGKYFAKKLNSKSIALMNPKGFKNNFFHIFAPFHDNPKKAENLTILPVNISFSLPKDIFTPKKEAIGIVVGGNNSIFKMDKNRLKTALLNIKKEFENYEIAITSSPRTPKNIEEMIEEMEFDYKVIFSKNKINPIPDFLYKCKYVFLTDDSTSMISEAVCNGNAKIEIIKLNLNKKANKYELLIENLVHLKALHIYNGRVGKNSVKINLEDMIKKALG